MSGTGTLSAPRWPAARNPYDICQCGDYLRDERCRRFGAGVLPDMPRIKIKWSDVFFSREV